MNLASASVSTTRETLVGDVLLWFMIVCSVVASSSLARYHLNLSGKDAEKNMLFCIVISSLGKITRENRWNIFGIFVL